MTTTYAAEVVPVTFTGSDGSTISMPLTLGPFTVPAPATSGDGGGQTPPPGRVQALWHQGWKGPAITSYPAALMSGLTHVELDMCQSSAAGTGRLADPPGVTAQQIDALGGIRVFAGIGGGSDGGIQLTMAAHVAQMLDSIKSMVDRLHVAGVVFDLEGTPGAKWGIPAVTDLAHTLVADGIGVAICSALYGGRREAWGQVAAALGTSLSWWERMFYDFPQATDSRLSGVVTGQDGFASMRPYLASNQQLVGTFMPTDPGDKASSPVPVLTAAYRAGAAGWPGAGWSVFHDQNDGPGYAAVRALMAVPASG